MTRLAPISLFFVFLLLSESLAATPPYGTALVIRMRMVQCAQAPRHGGLVTDILVGSAPMGVGNAECPEYEIEGPKVLYRIRPRRDVLLPVGDEVRFRLHKRDLLILTEDTNKEIVFSVVGMELKSRRAPAPENTVEKSREVSNRNCLTMEGEVAPCRDK